MDNILMVQMGIVFLYIGIAMKKFKLAKHMSIFDYKYHDNNRMSIIVGNILIGFAVCYLVFSLIIFPYQDISKYTFELTLAIGTNIVVLLLFVFVGTKLSKGKKER